MRRILWLLLCTVTFAFGGVQKMVIDLKTGDIEAFKSRFLNGIASNADYFRSQGDEVQIVVVVHGDAYKFFIEALEHTSFGTDSKLVAEQEELNKRLLEIKQRYGVKFEICQVGMNRLGILGEDLYPFVTPIHSSMSGLVRWQNLGYAYVPVH